MLSNEQLSPADILVVEDEPKLAALLRDYLQAAGHRVTCLDNGLAVVASIVKISKQQVGLVTDFTIIKSRV